ncbi:acyl carrier protein [Bacillus infantis]|uniref:Acyl carrier protein n=1 Tax=Bacillus infantis TaxID=324767 RepID=A0A5D4SCF3_9BACI|nr:acyl carrier protein [Bacillus infantis]TYS60659.1 acyl carrier protein [Bacillus infantis]
MSLDKDIYILLSDEVCGVFPTVEILPEKSLFEIGFDSLRFMELVVLIEEKFNIAFPDEMLEITSQTKVQDIVNIVSDCLKTSR